MSLFVSQDGLHLVCWLQNWNTNLDMCNVEDFPFDPELRMNIHIIDLKFGNTKPIMPPLLDQVKQLEVKPSY